MEPQIAASNPSSGTQHLRFKDDPVGFDAFATSPDFGPQPTGITTTSIDLFMACGVQGDLFADGAECSLRISGESISEGSVKTWEILFIQSFLVAPSGVERLGRIDVTGFGRSDVLFVSDAYRTLTVCDDPIALRTEFYYGEALVAVVGGASHLPGTRVEQIVFTAKTITDNNDVIDVDNITVESGRSSACRGASCGDGVHALGEDCDRFDDAACPGLCTLDCTCPTRICGNNIREGAFFEVCDGADDSLCPGNCFPPGHLDGFGSSDECTCGFPPEVVTGFEPAEGFSPEFIDDQAGWKGLVSLDCLDPPNCFDVVGVPVSLSEGHIDTANPASGTQHLRISFDPSPEVPGEDVGATPSSATLRNKIFFR